MARKDYEASAIIAVPVDGGKNSPSNANGADGEVVLDIEVSAAVAPGTKVAVYFAPNTDQGFINAVTTAVRDTTNKPSVISMSWGGPEFSWTQRSLLALDAACQSAGITNTVAAGENLIIDPGGYTHVSGSSGSPCSISVISTLASGELNFSRGALNSLR